MHLDPGGIYRVTRRFTDCHGTTLEPGRTFTYYSTSYWAYDGGYMLNCSDVRIDFKESENAELIENFSSYVEKIGRGEVPPEHGVSARNKPGTQDWRWWEIAIGLLFGVIAIAILVKEKPAFNGTYIAAVVILALIGYFVWVEIAWRWHKRK